MTEATTPATQALLPVEVQARFWERVVGGKFYVELSAAKVDALNKAICAAQRTLRGGGAVTPHFVPASDYEALKAIVNEALMCRTAVGMRTRLSEALRLQIAALPSHKGAGE